MNASTSTQPQRKSERLIARSRGIIAERQQLDIPKQPTKITGLIDDCLEKIFEHLDIGSLFNAAVANEYLRPAASNVFKRKFGTERVWIDITSLFSYTISF